VQHACNNSAPKASACRDRPRDHAAYQTAVEPCALRYAASAHKSSIVGSNAPVTPGFAAASLSRLTWRCTRPTRYGFALNSGRGPLAVRTAAQYDYLEKIDGFPDWDRVPPYEACPFEYKRADWGCLNGRLVAVDYSAPKLF
jgi:hypothetical protein